MTSSKIAVLGAVAALSIVGCASNGTSGGAQMPASSTGDLAMTIAFDPSPPKQGSETITISLKDASGSATKGATVRITTKMPDMGMTGPAMSAQDNGDGTYSAVANLSYQTKWVFDVTASSGGKPSSAEFIDNVK
jgi:hypothetical protein